RTAAPRLATRAARSGRSDPRARPALARPPASRGSGRRRRPSGRHPPARARSRRRRSRSPRRALARRQTGSGRRGTSASAGPVRRRGGAHSGRTRARAARTARVRGVCVPRPPRPYSGRMTVAEDAVRIASAAAAFAQPGEEVAGVLVADTLGRRVYLCAFEAAERHAWLALDADANPLTERRLVREAASVAALCEVAEESAGGGHLPELRVRLAELRDTDRPLGIEEAEAAAASLAETLQQEPRVASSVYLDAIGSASRRLEQALGESGASPFASAMQSALGSVEELTEDVERNYKL